MIVEESTTLVGRKEEIGNTYPMLIEKFTILCGIIIFFLTFSTVSQQFENKLLGILFTFIIYPFILLFLIDMFGRLIQKLHN